MSLPGIETHGLSCLAFDNSSTVLFAGGGALVRKPGERDSVKTRELIAWNVPKCDVRWHVVESSQDRIADLAVHPGGKELATKCTGDITIWSIAGKPLRTISSDFLAGPIVYSADGQRLIAPNENVLKVRSSETGRIVASTTIAKTSFTSAKAAAFIAGTSRVVVAARVINNKGQTSGKLLLVDGRSCEVLKSSKIDLDPDRLAIDPQGRWTCIAGQRRGRGCLLFWNLQKWRQINSQGAHGASVDRLAVSPDGSQLASTGEDHVIRLWNTTNGKAAAKLEEHQAEGSGTAAVAWSPNGQYIAFASAGKLPVGGVFLYEDAGGEWRLLGSPGTAARLDDATKTAADLRPLRVFGPDVTMDTVGNFSLPANQWPVKCENCRMPNLDAVPEPYLLSRGIDAPGDFSTAELGNFLVRDRARHVLEIAAPGACRFFSTFNAKSKEPTDWLLAVPQTAIVTAKLPEKFVQCSTCGEAKAVSHLEPLEFSPPEVDLFKSRQWTCSKIGEETPWYLEDYLKTTRDKLPRHQWTRLGLDRELWFSTRLLLLMKACKLKGCYASALENRKPTPVEAGWIKLQLERIDSVKPSDSSSMPGASDAVKWLRRYLSENAAARPLASRQTVADWEQKHRITLPKEYVEFVTTIGRHSFTDMFGMEGYSVRILGPKQLDDRTFRRDRPQDASKDPEPDGLMFAAANNGDCLCFDLAGPVGKYVVYHFDHETSAFTAFATDFSQAVRRLVERS